jgi:hypothetical protein
MGSIRGAVVDAGGAPIGGATIQFLRADGTGSPTTTKADRLGSFALKDADLGWHIVLAWDAGFRQSVNAVNVSTEGDVELSPFTLQVAVRGGDLVCLAPCDFPAPSPTPVLTVCEALGGVRGAAVVVGIFKSGMDETLRLDCPTQLVTGEVGWPSAIGLTKVGNVPDELRAEVEKKRQQILSSAPPEAQLRPERVVGLYGVFVSLAGLSNAKCCTAAVETTIPPARLFGISETDLRVIR